MLAALRRGCSLAIILILSRTSVPLNGSTVSTCDEAGLREALNDGGTVTFSCDGTIRLSSPILIVRDTTLDANGHNVTLSGDDSVRLLEVSSGITLGLVNITLANGRDMGALDPASASGGPGQGGAMKVQGGTVWALNCRLVGNKAVGDQGKDGNAATFIPPGAGGAGEGGAIYATAAILRLTNCVFSSNEADGGKGGNATGTIGIQFGGPGGTGRGGAICAVSSQLDLQNVTLENNKANRGAEGNGNQFSGDFPSTFGGAVYLDATAGTFMGCTWRSNGAATAGGACFSQGGALLCVGCSFEQNEVGTSLQARGGAIYTLSNRLALVSCSFRTNAAQGSSSFAIRAIGRFGGTAEGAAVSSIGGELAVSNCAFVANLAQGGDGSVVGPPLFALAAGSSRGGGIYNEGTATVINSTFAQNAARAGHSAFPDNSGAHGGAFGHARGQARIGFSTIADNRVSDTLTNIASSSGAGCSLLGGALVLANTILSDNLANTEGRTNVPANAAGPIEDGGHNLSSDSTPPYSAPGSHNNTDAKLGPLVDPDGSTATLALLPGSPAIDAGDDARCPATDQRGVARPALLHCDIGAYEFLPDSFAFTSISVNASSLTLHGTGIPGQSFRLQASLDFSGWADVGSGVVSPSGEFQILTTSSSQTGSQFYRIVAP